MRLMDIGLIATFLAGLGGLVSGHFLLLYTFVYILLNVVRWADSAHSSIKHRESILSGDVEDTRDPTGG